MGGDRTNQTDSIPAQPNTRLLEHSGFLDRIKHGAASVTHSASDLIHKGVEQGKEIAHSPTTKKIEDKVISSGKEIAHSPTTKKIEAGVISSGKQIGQEHMNEVKGVIHAGKNGDINGVLKNGLPLAGEAMLGPGGVALKIAKDKATEAALEHATPEQREKLLKAKHASEAASHGLPNLLIDGVSQEQKAKHSDSKR